MRCSGIEPFTTLDFPGHLACILFLPGCSMRCGFCHNPEFVLPETLQQIKDSFIPFETVVSFLQKRQRKLTGVVFSGGEPTVHADLPEAIARVHELGFEVKLDTNGHHPERLQEMLDSGHISYVAMDVKTDLSTYRALTGDMVHPERIAESMNIIRKSGVTYEFRTTLVKEFHTRERLLAMRPLFTKTDRLFLQQFRPMRTLDPAFGRYRGYTKVEMEAISGLFSEHVARVMIRST